MADVPVGTPSGGGIAGIPTKYLLIGGGAIALAFFFLNQKGGGTPAPSGMDPVYGAALGPNAALALGDLQTRLLQESGTLQEQMAGYSGKLNETLASYFGGLGDSISGLSTHLDARADELRDQGATQFTTIRGQLSTNYADLTRQQNLWGNFLAMLAQQQQDITRGYGPGIPRAG